MKLPAPTLADDIVEIDREFYLNQHAWVDVKTYLDAKLHSWPRTVDRRAEWRQRSNELRVQQHLADVEELDEMAPARGIRNGVIASLFIWAGLAVYFWPVVMRWVRG